MKALAFAFLLPLCLLFGLPVLAREHGTAHPARTVPALRDAAMPRVTVSPLRGRYSVIAKQLDVHDLLFALARDAKLNMDIRAGVQGKVTFNAVNQPVDVILDRLADLHGLRWSLRDGVLRIEPDDPYLSLYQVNYLNMSRILRSGVSVANSVTGTSAAARNPSCQAGNASCTSLESVSQHDFWLRLERSLQALLGVDVMIEQGSLASMPQVLAAGKGAEIRPASATAEESSGRVLDQGSRASLMQEQAESIAQLRRLMREERQRSNLVILHPESGVVLVYANQKQQQKVGEFLRSLQQSMTQQVLIEATVLEVALNDDYQTGVDWSRVAQGGGWSLRQSLLGSSMAQPPFFSLGFDGNNFDLTIRLLEQFGKTRVLSRPKLMALNNQTAIMKVVDELVYFRLEINETRNQDGAIQDRKYTSVLHTVPIGIVMQVTPQIGADGSVVMNIRPTITNVNGYVDDPAIALIVAGGGTPVKSQVPILQVREFDSTLMVNSGATAVLGGLIRETVRNERAGIPVLSSLPVLGDLFSYREEHSGKLELVVLLRPVVLNSANQQEISAAHGVLPEHLASGVQAR